jgi:NAD(P)-dependent dehydrogenase (short-subunit alcohol dehydrogenase family)
MNIKSKTVLITGANRGIGRALVPARLLSSKTHIFERIQ